MFSLIIGAHVPEALKESILTLHRSQCDSTIFSAHAKIRTLMTENNYDTDIKKAVFDVLDFPFLNRLLSGSIREYSFHSCMSLGLSLLNCFTSEKDLVTHKHMLMNVRNICKIIKNFSSEISGDAYSLLKATVQHEAGKEVMFNAGVISLLIDAYGKQVSHSDIILDILLEMVVKYGYKMPKVFHSLMNKLAIEFVNAKEERKFKLCSIMTTFLYNCHIIGIGEKLFDQVWPKCIYYTLFEILTQEIPDEKRQSAIILASEVLRLCGSDWVRMVGLSGKFLLLLVQLATEEVNNQLIGKILTPDFTQSKLITACCLILEITVDYLIGRSHDLLCLKDFLNIHTTLNTTFLTAISFLPVEAKYEELTFQEKVIICALIRFLATCLKRKTSTYSPDVYRAMPFIIKFANKKFYSCMKKTSEPTGELIAVGNYPFYNFDLLKVMLPVFCDFVLEDEGRKLFFDLKQDEVVFEFLKHYWSGFRRKGRLIFLDFPSELKVMEIFPNLDETTAVITTFNVFITLLTYEEDLMKRKALSVNLQNFITSIYTSTFRLSKGYQNLIISGNLTVLGLLLLKQQQNRISNSWPNKEYTIRIIKFFKKAYTVDPVYGSTVEMTYVYRSAGKDLEDLWFLGMHLFSQLFKSIPLFAECVIECWLNDIVRTFDKALVDIPNNVKIAFEEFICHLVEANQSAIALLKEHNGLEMCRRRTMTKLMEMLEDDSS